MNIKAGDRIKFDAWGNGEFDTPAYAVMGEDDYEPQHAVARAIAAKSGKQTWGVNREGETRNAQNETVSVHYRTNLGRPISQALGGGFAVRAEVWFAIPTPPRISTQNEED